MIRESLSQPIYLIGCMCEYHRDLDNMKAGCIKAGKRYGDAFYCDRHAKRLGLWKTNQTK